MLSKNVVSVLFGVILLTSCTSQGINQGFTETPSTQTTLSNATPSAFVSDDVASPVSSTASPIPKSTLNPTDAEKILLQRLNVGEDCENPCFLDISVEQTEVEDAIMNIEEFGFPVKLDTSHIPNIYYSTITGDKIGKIHVEFTAQDNRVQALHARIGGSEKMETVKWPSYSPEEILKKYGMPDRLEFFSESNPGAQNNPGYSMQIYYSNAKLVFLYYYASFNPPTSSQICPSKDQFRSIDLWIGNAFDGSQSHGKTLEKVTGLSLNQFYKLILEGDAGACLDLDLKALSS